MNMMEVKPHIGIGDVRFGMKRDDVMALLGPKQTWEQWMGGNLNDSLFYPGIILYFDEYDSSGPLPAGKLVQIEVSSDYPCTIFGSELKKITREIVLSGIDASTAKHYPNRSIEAEGLGMRFFFNTDGSLSNLSFERAEAQQSVATDRPKTGSG
jgi:hypothetical protein